MAANLKIGSILTTAGISWQVLALNGNTALLISKDIIAILPYYFIESVDCRGYVDSVIRAWLNGAFLNSLPSAFSNKIIPTKLRETELIEGFDYKKYGLEDSSFEDKVFLLTESEAKVLFTNNALRCSSFSFNYLKWAEPKEYAALSDEERSTALGCNSWWLRTLNPDKHQIVSSYGEIIDSYPISISTYLLNDLDRAMYDSMSFSHDESFSHLLFAMALGTRGLRTALVGSMIKGNFGLGVRPATWIRFGKTGE